MTAFSSSPTPPNLQERQEMWESLDFPHVKIHFPAIERFLVELRPLYLNGKVEHAAFEIPEHPEFEWRLSRKQCHETGFFEQLWKCRSVSEIFPCRLMDLNFLDKTVFSFISPLDLGGCLAGRLSWSGAYGEFDQGENSAIQLGTGAGLEMLGGSHDQTLVFECVTNWSEFFCGICWDYTIIVIDFKERLIHTLLATDTD